MLYTAPRRAALSVALSTSAQIASEKAAPLEAMVRSKSGRRPHCRAWRLKSTAARRAAAGAVMRRRGGRGRGSEHRTTPLTSAHVKRDSPSCRFLRCACRAAWCNAPSVPCTTASLRGCVRLQPRSGAHSGGGTLCAQRYVQCKSCTLCAAGCALRRSCARSPCLCWQEAAAAPCCERSQPLGDQLRKALTTPTQARAGLLSGACCFARRCSRRGLLTTYSWRGCAPRCLSTPRPLLRRDQHFLDHLRESCCSGARCRRSQMRRRS